MTGLISHVVPVDSAAEAFDLLDQHPSEVLQLVFAFEEEPLQQEPLRRQEESQ